MYSIAQPKEKGPFLHSIGPTPFFNESNSVARDFSCATAVVSPESRTNVCTKIRRRNQQARATMSSIAKPSQWVFLLLLSPTLPPAFYTIRPGTFLVCFPFVSRMYTHWSRHS
ncbi:hypothetical protein BDM02DRAFT_1139362 [Thelephora ganbajun]|uniref:Uncharacterized protein n=1 Tax=Thelephora ganbajun TaxID=370292 RepID=A0ACB6ZXB1_THEGA|nr:hypothetical protein BDM02DRAFT_1139362 [Thelephora ganbajun]